MFKRFLLGLLVVLLGAMAGSKPVQAMFCPEDWYNEPALESRDVQEQIDGERELQESRLGMIQDDDFFVKVLQETILENHMKDIAESARGFFLPNNDNDFDARAENRLVFDIQELIQEHNLSRLSVKRKLLIALCDLSDQDFRKLSNEKKKSYFTDELQVIFEKSSGYKTRIQCWLETIKEIWDVFLSNPDNKLSVEGVGTGLGFGILIFGLAKFFEAIRINTTDVVNYGLIVGPPYLINFAQIGHYYLSNGGISYFGKSRFLTTIVTALFTALYCIT